jgi:hypothetical protein
VFQASSQHVSMLCGRECSSRKAFQESSCPSPAFDSRLGVQWLMHIGCWVCCCPLVAFCLLTDVLEVSAKTGLGLPSVLPAVVE